MHSLRNRLIVAFFIATVLPLAATIWIATSLLERSLGYATTEELDGLSRTLEETVRQFYGREREALKQDALAGRSSSATYAPSASTTWPETVRAFWESGDAERFDLSGSNGDRIDYMRRSDAGVVVFSRDLGGIRMQELSLKLTRTRALIGSIQGRDLRRGFTLTLLLLVALVWLLSLAPLMFMAHRISRPIRQLTAGLTRFAARRRSGARRDRVQPHGRAASPKPRAVGVSDSDVQLAVAGPQDGP